MKFIQTFSLILAVAALAACGSKNKKSSDEPQKTQSATADRDDKPAPDTSDTEGDDAPDPASLKDRIWFEFDSSDLSDSARAALEENAKWLKEDAARTVLIEGHTDEQGTNEYNLGLGDRRARAAKDYIVALGIDEKRVRIITYGEERPESPDDAKNRRSVFIATKKK